MAEKVPWQLFKRAASDGTVLVLAGLRTPWQREEQLTEDLKIAPEKSDPERPKLCLGGVGRHTVQGHAAISEHTASRSALDSTRCRY